MEQHHSLLLEFLNTPLCNGDTLFDRFAALPRAVIGKGNTPLERYVYIPGTRDDRVVLVAHIDTVWDTAYGKTVNQHDVQVEDGVFFSGNPACGIGADDRAGCAMLWELRESGHSLLLTDGEEHGKRGARYLKKHHRRVFAELNKHRYMIELDWAGTDGCLYNQVDNTAEFKQYIEQTLGFSDSKKGGGTDLQVLCRRVCGVNVGVGYHHCHSPKETLVLSEWEHTLAALTAFLAKPQPRFRCRFWPYYIRLAKAAGGKVLRILKLKK